MNRQHSRTKVAAAAAVFAVCAVLAWRNTPQFASAEPAAAQTPSASTTLSLPADAAANAARATELSAALAASRYVDLTHAFDARTIYWPTEIPFRLERVSAGVTPGGWYYAANRFCMAEHSGTHIDAPIHFFAGRRTVDEIPLAQLVGAGAVVDVAAECREDADYQVPLAAFQAWERRTGQSLDERIVLVRTGYGQFWPDRAKYLGTAETGAAAVAKLHFPGVSPQAARWLAVHRRIKAIGIDTASIDHGASPDFATHVMLCEHNVPAFENVAHLDALPESGFSIVALPMKIAGGSGGPLRIVAILPQ